MMNWYIKCLKQYADFRGRARRKEYWTFTLFNMIFIIVTVFIWFISSSSLEFFIPFGIYILAMIIPLLSVTVRRLHDTGKNEWMSLISLIPIIGPIWLVTLMCADSDSEENHWGVNPKI